MKGKTVLIQFPFDHLSSSKVRPAYCLTDAVGNYQHIVFALITSRIPSTILSTDIILQAGQADFAISGLLKPATLRLDHLVTLRRSMIRRELGSISLETQTRIANLLFDLFKPNG